MNAQEARALATSVVTEEQKTMMQTAMQKIEDAAKQGRLRVLLDSKNVEWLAAALYEQGYDVTTMHSQHDGGSVEVSW